MWLLLSCIAMTVMLLAAPARAQTPAEKAQAQVLFDEARALIEAGKTEQACAKFAASYQLDPAMGTQLNLAVCYRKLGRTASAWALFIEIRTTARRANQQKRAAFAHRQADELAPKLSKLRVDVAKPAPGLVITSNGEALADTAWGSLVPIDPGKVEVKAAAPGKKSWTKTVSVGAVADQVVVAVPVLEDAPAAVAPAAADHPSPLPRGPKDQLRQDGADGTVPKALGWTAIGVGAAGGVAGLVLRILALGTDDDSKQYCLPDDPLKCTQQGQDLRDQAQAMELGSTIAWIAGGVVLTTGVVLLLTAPSSEAADEPAARLEWRATAGLGRGDMALRLSW